MLFIKSIIFLIGFSTFIFLNNFHLILSTIILGLIKCVTFLFLNLIEMLFGVLLILLVGAALGINLIGGLFRILFFFLMISILWFIVKAGFYVLFFFAVVYFGIKGIIYISELLSNFFDGKSHKKYNRVPYGDAEIIEMLE